MFSDTTTSNNNPKPPQQSPPPPAQQPQQQMTAEQYHLMMLQYQLQQSQAHAQAQAQLLAMYQQQQQQQQLQSAASAYHQALAQVTRSQASMAYGLPNLPNNGMSPFPQPPQQQQQQQQQQQPGGNMFGNFGGLSGFPNFPGTAPLAPPAAPTPHAMPSTDVSSGDGSNTSPAGPTDARIHANLASTCVEWVPLPPRYVMDSVAKTAANAKLARQRKEAVEAGLIPADDDKAPVPNRPSKTVFVGGISYDVARDARVLPWLAASMCKKPVVVRKVIPHKERKGKGPDGLQQGAGSAHAPPKLALSAFVVVDGDEAEALVEALHHRVLWDIGGCWLAKTPEAVEALRDYANAQCTWQRREQGAAAGLPRHMMTVEGATAMGSHDKQGAPNARRTAASTTANFGHSDNPCVDLGFVANPPPSAPDATPPHQDANPLKFDWGVHPSPEASSSPQLGFVAVTKSPQARSPSSRSSGSGNIGDR